MAVRDCTNMVRYAGARASKGRGIENGISHIMRLTARALYSPVIEFNSIGLP